jgi:hypothetical protein
MPEPGSASPALSLAALGETVDLLGVVVARMSEKLDQHGETLAAVQKTALESRDAAQAAKAYADPQRYGRHIGNEIDKALAVPSTGWKACTWASLPIGGTPAAPWTSWSGRKSKPFSACATIWQGRDAGRSAPHS